MAQLQTTAITGSVSASAEITAVSFTSSRATGVGFFGTASFALTPAGTAGSSGTSGTAGSAGTSGSSGTSGSTGTSGSSGTAGSSGTSGTRGSSGSSGTSGANGSSGSSGATGASGSSGSTGTSGSSGATGASGSSGSAGTAGSSGTSGTRGSSGSSGTTGANGANGSSGSSGTTGANGANGSSGTSGTSATVNSGAQYDMGGIRVTAASTSTNNLRFYGLSGDSAGSYNHGGIDERLWGASDQSELFIYKGNDPDSCTNCEDQVRIASSGRIVFHSADAYYTMDAYLTAFNSNRTGSMYINGNTVVIPNGSLGVGTSPSFKLDVNGRLGVTDIALGRDATYLLGSNLWAGTSGYPGYQFSGGNSRFGFSSTGGVIDVYADGNFYATDNSYLVLHTNNYSSYALPLSGGTISGNLTVTGTADMQGVLYHRSNVRVLNKAATDWVTWATRNTAGSDSVIDLSNIGTFTSTAQTLNSTNSTFNSTNFNVNSTNITIGNDATDAVGISNNSMYVYNGNVGIGTTSPGSKLHINGAGTRDGLQINTIQTYVTERLTANGTQARRFEIARLGIDYNDWNGGIGPFIVEIFEAYYSRGLYKRYVVNYGYSQNSSCDLVEYQGSGDNQYQVTISSPVQVSGDNYYISVYVDVRYYGQCDVRIQTNRTRTSNSTPGIGETYVNLNPSPSNISDFTADSQVTLARNANAYLVGNVGIGTTTPQGKLAVEGVALIGQTTSGAYVTTSKLHIAGSGTGQISFEDIGAATSGMALDGTNFSIGHQDANVTYYFRYSNTYNGDYANTGTVLAAFNKDNSYVVSNFGVNRSSPDARLHVVQNSIPGSIAAATSGTTVLLDSSATNNYITFRVTADTGKYSGFTFADNNVGGYIVFRTYVGSGANDGTNGDAMYYGAYTDHIFQTGASETVNGKTEAFRIKDGGDARLVGSLFVSTGNTTGKGIVLADDGDIVDLNDGYCAMRFTYGVRVHGGNRTGGAVIALRETGNIIASADVIAYGSPSDITLKENINTVTNALDTVTKLRGVTFQWKETADAREMTNITDDIGFIAQEVQEVLPTVVRENPNGKLSLRDKAIIPLLVEAIKEQQTTIQQLQARIEALETL